MGISRHYPSQQQIPPQPKETQFSCPRFLCPLLPQPPYIKTTKLPENSIKLCSQAAKKAQTTLIEVEKIKTTFYYPMRSMVCLVDNFSISQIKVHR